VRAFLDTSVLLPVFLTHHPHHQASLEIFLRCAPDNSCCAAHSLAELYSTVTRLPKYRVSSEHAMLLLREVRERLTLVALDQEEYYTAIERASIHGITGGTIYDALLASCALKARAEILYTWNTRHFQQFEIAERVRTP
jgi:predicted nucleic acid-binding protein